VTRPEDWPAPVVWSLLLLFCVVVLAGVALVVWAVWFR